MKKFFGLLIGAAAGYALWVKVQQEREERDIWAEVTDSFGETPEDIAAFAE